MDPDLQFEEEYGNSLGGRGSFLPRLYAHKVKKRPFLIQACISAHIAKNDAQAQRALLVFSVALLIISVYYFKQALTPSQIVPIKF